jgi:hypothetical protein
MFRIFSGGVFVYILRSTEGFFMASDGVIFECLLLSQSFTIPGVT